MKINFIIPNIPSKPTGGYKVMYEYANIFAEKGHDVFLYHVATINGIHYRIPHWLRIIRTKLFYKESKPKWFQLSNKIQTINIPRIDSSLIRKTDVQFLTMWAEVLDFAPIGDSLGKRINLIQGYETWMSDSTIVHNSYKTGTINIAISKYLSDIVENETGIQTPIVPNSINEVFKIITPPQKRKEASVSMLYSEIECKGSRFGIEALKKVHYEIPNLTVEMFGIFNPPQNLPEWIHYHKEPKDLCALYNSVSIHLSPGINEGWDLPCTEAMKCGCALVCTDIEGHKEYAREGETALLAKTCDADSLAQQIIKVITDNQLREKLIKNGQKETEKYTIEQSYHKILDIIKNSSI